MTNESLPKNQDLEAANEQYETSVARLSKMIVGGYDWTVHTEQIMPIVREIASALNSIRKDNRVKEVPESYSFSRALQLDMIHQGVSDNVANVHAREIFEAAQGMLLDELLLLEKGGSQNPDNSIHDEAHSIASNVNKLIL